MGQLEGFNHYFLYILCKSSDNDLLSISETEEIPGKNSLESLKYRCCAQIKSGRVGSSCGHRNQEVGGSNIIV